MLASQCASNGWAGKGFMERWRPAQCHLIFECSRVAAAENSPTFQHWVLRNKELKSRRDG